MMMMINKALYKSTFLLSRFINSGNMTNRMKRRMIKNSNIFNRRTAVTQYENLSLTDVSKNYATHTAELGRAHTTISTANNNKAINSPR